MEEKKLRHRQEKEFTHGHPAHKCQLEIKIRIFLALKSLYFSLNSNDYPHFTEPSNWNFSFLSPWRKEQGRHISLQVEIHKYVNKI